MKVLVGSKNPVKLDAVKEAFSKYFEEVEVVGLSVDSNVPDQPVNDQTFKGAENRALALKKLNEEQGLGASFFVGIEGGVVKLYSKWFAVGGVCILDEEGRAGFGTSPFFELPSMITARLLNGVELGEVIDELSGDKNTKQKHGAAGFLTKGVMNRKELYAHGLTVALIPFLNEELYF